MSRSVYVIGGDNGPLKIGIATDAKRRLASIQTGSPDRLSVRHVTEIPEGKARAVEAAAHSMLRERRRVGEWFDVTLEEACEAIRQAMLAIDDGDSPTFAERDEESSLVTAFLERHGLTQVEFAAWLGTEKGTVWRWTLPPEDKNSRAVPLGVRAFCIAYELMPERVRPKLVDRLKRNRPQD